MTPTRINFNMRNFIYTVRTTKEAGKVILKKHFVNLRPRPVKTQKTPGLILLRGPQSVFIPAEVHYNEVNFTWNGRQ